jgi:hypothetical protein
MTDDEKKRGPLFPRLPTSLHFHNNENHAVYSVRSILSDYTKVKEIGDKFIAGVFFEDVWGEFAFFQKITRQSAVCLWRGDAKNLVIQNTWIGARDMNSTGHMLFMDMGATIKGLSFVENYFAAMEEIP